MMKPACLLYTALIALLLLTGCAEPAGQVPSSRAELNRRFPVVQSTRIHVLGGNVRGFGMLAGFSEPGPREVYLRRTTRAVKGEPIHPITLVRVIDPEGNLVAWRELTDQPDGTTEVVLPVPRGGAGIWRVSFSGGRTGDEVAIGLPATQTWGVRGEMSLTVSDTTPKEAWLYVPRTSTHLVVRGFGKPEAAATFFDEADKQLGRPAWQARSRSQLLVVDDIKPKSLVKVNLSGYLGNALAFDGLPGLLCPDPDSARALRGGTVEADGVLCAGPLQARARRWAVAAAERGLEVKLDWPRRVPADLDDPILESLVWAKYGPLSSLDGGLASQVTDPSSPYLGASFRSEEALKKRDTWEDFLHGGVLSPFASSALASAVVVPGRLNPAQGHPALTRRAALSAMFHLASLQGDDIIREKDLRTTTYPMTHAFFVFDGNLGRAFMLLEDRLDPEARAIWKQGLMAVADKLGDHIAYQSNQGAHAMMGHLHTYVATGQRRFLGYFERLMNGYLDCAWTVNSNFGQHPAGFYLENHGPDGNYDHLNTYCVATAYFEYRALPEADPELVQKLRRAIDRSLHFKSLFWLPQPDGEIASPTAINNRTGGVMGRPSYPGDYMTKAEFPLALRRWTMNPVPEEGAYPATIFPHLAHTHDWAMRLLQEMVPQRGHAFELHRFMGSWAWEIYHSFNRPTMVEPAPVPVEQVGRTWELPGLVATRQPWGYLMVFYDVAGSTTRLNGRFGGGPTALWTKPTGSVVLSLQNKGKFTVKGPDDVTHSGIFGKDKDGTFFFSGRERCTMKWLDKGKTFEVRSHLKPIDGTLVWRYDVSEADNLTVSVSLTSGKVNQAKVNLPVPMFDGSTVALKDGRLVYTIADHRATIRFDKAHKANLTDGLPTSWGDRTVRCLRIDLPTNGTPVTFTFGGE